MAIDQTNHPPLAICVPVRNEERSLPALLDALAGQRDCDITRITLCLLLDGCEDGSAELVQARASCLPFPIILEHGACGRPPNAGAARGRAMDLGEAHLCGRDDGVLLTTDADSAPAEDWIARTLRALVTADIVAGRIVRADATPGDRLSRLEAYLDQLYDLRRTIDPVPWDQQPGHHFTAGASLAFRGAAYRAAGGFPPLASGEDAAIVDAAQRLGLRVRRDPAVIVTTSGRRDGRAPGGLAATLRRLDDERCGAARVGDPAAAIWQYERHALARMLFPDMPDPVAIETLRRQIGLPAAEIAEVAGECANEEAFAIRIVPAAPGHARTLPLEQAEQALAGLARERLGCAA